jgi:4-amino-4-deoxy-L-arabinose transferase-like glycosyltransferase
MAVCAVWAGLISYLSGMRGFFAMDQSIVFDGAWRILQGQIPFRDFFLPHGPLSMWIQALAFHLFGVSYHVYALTAAAMNVAGAWLAYGTFRILVPETKWPAWAAGLLTGSWLYAPMGTTYIEQTGFFFLWIAVFAVVRGMGESVRFRQGWMAAAGLALAAAIVAKTNTGVLAVPSLVLMPALVRERPARETLRDWMAIGAGLILGIGLFYLWLAWASDPTAFQRHVLEIAGREGRKRILENKEFHLIVCSLFNGKGNDLIRLLTVSAYVLMGLGIAMALGPCRRHPGAARIRLFGLLGLLWVGYQHAFGVTSNNNGINEQPFLGLIFVCAVLVGGEVAGLLGDKSPCAGMPALLKRSVTVLVVFALLFTAYFYVQGIRGMGNYDFGVGVLLALGAIAWMVAPQVGGTIRPQVLAWGSGLVLGALFVIGTWGSFFRQAQDFFNFNTRYVVHGEIPILRGLAWAEGVNDDAREMHPSWEELVKTWRVLKEAPGRFYLLGNYTILYAAVDKPSLGILSWFFKGLTYSQEYDPAFDARFAAQIDQPDVTYIVTEEDFGLKYKLEDFPALERVLREKYRPEQNIGLFRLHRRIGTEAQ